MMSGKNTVFIFIRIEINVVRITAAKFTFKCQFLPRFYIDCASSLLSNENNNMCIFFSLLYHLSRLPIAWLVILFIQSFIVLKIWPKYS